MKSNDIAEALLQTLGWKRLGDVLPPKGVVVDWYDAMFDTIDTFAMKEPENFDGDYVYWRYCYESVI